MRNPSATPCLLVLLHAWFRTMKKLREHGADEVKKMSVPRQMESMLRRQPGLNRDGKEPGLGLAKAVPSVVATATDYLTLAKDKASSTQQGVRLPLSRPGRASSKRKAAGTKRTTRKGKGSRKGKTATRTKNWLLSFPALVPREKPVSAHHLFVSDNRASWSREVYVGADNQPDDVNEP